MSKQVTKIANSSNIQEVDYNKETKELGITFKPAGKRYEYQGVGEDIYQGMINAPSAGKYFYANIKGKFE